MFSHQSNSSKGGVNMAQNIEMRYLNSSGQYVKMVPHTIASDNGCLLIGV